MTQPKSDVGKVALAAAAMLQHAPPGDLAELRRMTSQNHCPPFWQFAARHDIPQQTEEKWAHILKLLALLTPTGSAGLRPDIHNPRRPLGAVLCDGGDANSSIERPVLSENRLARLLAARGKSRADGLERAVRMLARKQVSVDVPDLAWAVLTPESDKVTRNIARAYYNRLTPQTSEDNQDD